MDLNVLVQELVPKQMETNQSMEGIQICSIHMDSRQVEQGSLFVCLKGFNVDGHRFVQQAVLNGAVAILAQQPVNVSVPVIIVPDTRRALAYVADRFYGSPTRSLRLIGITGTNGKTTIAHLVECMLEDHGFQTGRMGTIDMKIGIERTPMVNTTPESLDLQKNFAQMVTAGCSHAVIEVSSHALHMGRVRGCNVGIAIFTNLTQDHLDYHGSMEAYKQAKALLFAQLGNRYDAHDLKFAILNVDDEVSDEYAKCTPAQILTYGIRNESADIRAKHIQLTAQGTTFVVECFHNEEQFDVQLLGMFNVYNVLAAVATGFVEGLTLAEMKSSMVKMSGIRGRMEPVYAGQDYTVIVDYAHTPDSLQNVLETMKEFAKGKVYCIIGCGGDRDRSKRPIMAQICAHYADMSILTSDNPRSESPKSIIDDMLTGLSSNNMGQNKYKVMIDRKEAINWAINQAQKDDLILIAGKGHETYQDIDGKRFDFDDREIALQALRHDMSDRERK